MRIFLIVILFIYIISCSPYSPDKETIDTYQKAKLNYLQGNLNKAEQDFREILKKDPEFYQASFMLGKTLFSRNMLTEAEQIFGKLLEKNPMYREAEIWLIRTEIINNKLESAEKRLKTLLAYDSNDPRLLFLLAQVHQINDNFQGSIEYFERTLLYKEDLARAHLELAMIYYQFGMEEKSLKELEMCMYLLPEQSPLNKPVLTLMEDIIKTE